MATVVGSHNMATVIRNQDNPYKNLPLHHYLELAHKGHNTGKIHVHQHRLYRHGQSHHPRGVHDFQNIQWDPSIYRGKSFRDFREKNMPPFTKTFSTYKYCNSNAKPEHPTTHPVKKPKMATPAQTKLGGIIRPTTLDIMTEDAKSEGRKGDQGITGMGWEEFIIEQAKSSHYKDIVTQTDHIRDTFLVPSILHTTQKCVTTAIGPSRFVQANIGYTGSAAKDDPIHPMIDVISSKVLEQSLLEAAEEQELQRMHVEVRKYMERRIQRQAKNVKLIENEVLKLEQRNAQKALLDKQLAEENDAEQRIASAIFATQVSKGVVDRTFYSLQQMGFIETLENAISTNLEEYCNDGVLSRISPVTTLVLNDIIKNANLGIERDAALLMVLNNAKQANTGKTAKKPGREVSFRDSISKRSSGSIAGSTGSRTRWEE